MSRNLGNIDRVVRAFVVAPLAIIIAALVGASTVFGVILLVVAGIMLATAAVGFCPLYRILGITSCPVPRRHAHG